MKINTNTIQELHDFLTGEGLPKGVTISKRHQPKLSPEKAMTVIWFLQEHLRIIPDIYEMCDVCKNIYDSEEQGLSFQKGGHVCDNCTTEKHWRKHKKENGV